VHPSDAGYRLIAETFFEAIAHGRPAGAASATSAWTAGELELFAAPWRGAWAPRAAWASGPESRLDGGSSGGQLRGIASQDP
jgi:hypothetical protein